MRLEFLVLLIYQSVRPSACELLAAQTVFCFDPSVFQGCLLLRKMSLTLHTAFIVVLCHHRIPFPIMFSPPLLPAPAVSLVPRCEHSVLTLHTYKAPWSSLRCIHNPSDLCLSYFLVYSLFLVEYIPKQLFKKGHGEGELGCLSLRAWTLSVCPSLHTRGKAVFLRAPWCGDVFTQSDSCSCASA